MPGVDVQHGIDKGSHRIEVLFDDQIDGIVEQGARFFEVATHVGFKVGLHLLKLSSQFGQIAVQVPGLFAVPEVNGVQWVKPYILKGQFKAAIGCQLLKFIAHAEKTRARIKGEPVLFELVHTPPCLGVLFQDGHGVTAFDQPKGC